MRLRNYRAARGLTQAEAADQVGIHQTAFSKLESGERQPRRETLRKIREWSGGQVTAADFEDEPPAVSGGPADQPAAGGTPSPAAGAAPIERIDERKAEAA